MSSLRRQRGEGKAGCIFWSLLFLIGGMLAWQMIPAKIADMQLKDHLEEMARHNPSKDGPWFREQILRRAKDLEIPLKQEDVTVEKTQRRVRMKVKYTVSLDFIFTSFPWTFSHDVERDIFII
ncbi:MAG TPA: hypothetical protein VGG06_35675 [Thermoanaerobaculia bacterium]|jgi:hypothetical protein